MAELNAGNLYEMNKTLIEKTETKIKGKNLFTKLNNEVAPYLEEKCKDSTLNYFIFLCKEKADYTILRVTEDADFIEILNCLKTCFLTRGAVFGIDRTPDGVAVEIWLKTDDDGELHCYYLFPCDEMVVEF